ncbi:MAG: hypothetical protein WBB62_18510 [Rhodococcus sp. (in: high G+C Gram-positive bacteria)]
MLVFLGPLLAALDALRIRRGNPERWKDLTRRGGWTWKFSRLDVLVYGNVVLTVDSSASERVA